MKKTIALLLCLLMLSALMTGCGSGTQVEYYADEAEDTAEASEAAAAEAEEETPAEEADLYENIAILLGGTGYDTYAPDTVVGTVNGSEVTWKEYFYWLNYYAVSYVETAAAYGLPITGWDAVGELFDDPDQTLAEVIVSYAQNAVTVFHTMETQSAEQGVELTEEQYEQVLADVEARADLDGDGTVTDEERAQLEATMAEQYIDTELMIYFTEMGYLSDALFEAGYGEFGSRYSDEATLQYLEDNGADDVYWSAKHILLMTIDRETREALDEDTVARKLDTATTLQAELAEVQDDKEALIALFDEYMDEYTEDDGYAYYPDGYVFGAGEMVEEFENAVKSLDKNYGLSDVVESAYGYHIILRQPLQPDDSIYTDAGGNEITFRYLAAQEQFDLMLNLWIETADVQWADGFNPPDMLAIFG